MWTRMPSVQSLVEEDNSIWSFQVEDQVCVACSSVEGCLCNSKYFGAPPPKITNYLAISKKSGHSTKKKIKERHVMSVDQRRDRRQWFMMIMTVCLSSAFVDDDDGLDTMTLSCIYFPHAKNWRRLYFLLLLVGNDTSSMCFGGTTISYLYSICRYTNFAEKLWNSRNSLRSSNKSSTTITAANKKNKERCSRRKIKDVKNHHDVEFFDN